MDIKAEFLRIMAEQTEIALATSVNNVPNVRIVNFYFEPAGELLILFEIRFDTAVVTKDLHSIKTIKL